MRSGGGHTINFLSFLLAKIRILAKLPHLHGIRDTSRSIPVAVVRSGPDGAERVVEHPLVPVHHQLMGAKNELDIVGVVELRIEANLVCIPSRPDLHQTNNRRHVEKGPNR